MRRLITVFLLFLTAFLSACGGPPEPSESSSASGELPPEITDELIYERINDTWVRDVPEETGIAPPISWNFDHDEPKEITVVDKKMSGTSATIVLDIKTTSSPRARANRQLSGQIRTEWELRTGLVLRRWEIIDAENISMKYKDLPKPAEQQNSNR